MRYSFTIKGALSDRLGSALGAVETERSGFDTTLSLDVRDQAAMLGIIEKISDFGLELIAMEPCREPDGHPTAGLADPTARPVARAPNGEPRLGN
jgi:hypothetical protein